MFALSASLAKLLIMPFDKQTYIAKNFFKCIFICLSQIGIQHASRFFIGLKKLGSLSLVLTFTLSHLFDMLRVVNAHTPVLNCLNVNLKLPLLRYEQCGQCSVLPWLSNKTVYIFTFEYALLSLHRRILDCEM